MKAVIKNVLLLVSIFISLFYAATVYAGEIAKPVFDQRSWKLGWSQDRGDAATEEYVLAGESVDNWSELVTIQIFRGLQKATNLDVFESTLKVRLSLACPSIKWVSMSQSENERIWKWTIKDCPGQPDQSELNVAKKTKEAIHVWHYAIKKSPLPQDIETVWLKNLKAIKIENSK